MIPKCRVTVPPIFAGWLKICGAPMGASACQSACLLNGGQNFHFRFWLPLQPLSQADQTHSHCGKHTRRGWRLPVACLNREPLVIVADWSQMAYPLFVFHAGDLACDISVYHCVLLCQTVATEIC